MGCRFPVQLALLVGALCGFAEGVFANSGEFPLSVARTDVGVDAVLVLCPGMNQNGDFFLKESPWMDFAEKNNFGVIAVGFRSDPDHMYGEERRGYYWPEQGSGDALLRAVDAHFGPDLPIFIYGFSGGAQFASRFAEWAPDRVSAFVAYSAQFWDAPSGSSVSKYPLGVIACGELDGIRWFPSFSYYFEGRALERPWLWVSLKGTGHVRHRKLEEFARAYFLSVHEISGDERGPVYVDIESCEQIEAVGQEIHPQLTAVLPSLDLLDDWKVLHLP